MAFVKPLLPDEMIVAISAARSRSMIAFLTSPSHGMVNSPPPRLMLTDEISYVNRRS